MAFDLPKPLRCRLFQPTSSSCHRPYSSKRPFRCAQAEQPFSNVQRGTACFELPRGSNSQTNKAHVVSDEDTKSFLRWQELSSCVVLASRAFQILPRNVSPYACIKRFERFGRESQSFGLPLTTVPLPTHCFTCSTHRVQCSAQAVAKGATHVLTAVYDSKVIT